MTSVSAAKKTFTLNQGWVDILAQPNQPFSRYFVDSPRRDFALYCPHFGQQLASNILIMTNEPWKMSHKRNLKSAVLQYQQELEPVIS